MEPEQPLTGEERRAIIDTIPELGDIDSCKENIQPSRGGRSAATLTTLLNPENKEALHEMGRKMFAEKLSTLDEQDDPLQTYIDYVEWTNHMFPQGPKGGSNLLKLLTDATSQFIDDRRYKYDARYLKLWLEYAKFSDDPKELYLFLITHDIGQTLSLFYEDYAGYYERMNRFDEAAEVFELGISRNADPLNRLKRNYTKFQTRVKERKARGLVEQQQMEAKMQMESLRSTGQRTMLGQKFDAHSRVSVHSNVHAGLESRFGSTGSSSSSPTTIRNRSFGNSSSATLPKSPSQSFSVFVESSTPTTPSRSSVLPTARSSSPSISSPAHTSSSLHIGSSHRRENQRHTEKFSGATIPQAPIASTVQPVVEKFRVYQDPPSSSSPTFERTNSASSGLSMASEGSSSKERRYPTFDPSTAGMKKRQRTERANHTYSQLEIEAQKQLEKRFAASNYLLSSNSKGGTEYIAVEKGLNQKCSFEERRAMLHGMIEYTSNFTQVQETVVVEEEMTEETRAAIRIVDGIYRSEANYTQEEKDLTWTAPYQTFKLKEKKTVNENE